MREIRHKWGKIDPSYLASDKFDYLFIACFDAVPGGGHKGKVSKKIVLHFLFLRNHLKFASPHLN